jgi:hypothetical protein
MVGECSDALRKAGPMLHCKTMPSKVSATYCSLMPASLTTFDQRSTEVRK